MEKTKEVPAKINLDNGTEKTKVLIMSDIMVAPTGVGGQAFMLSEGLIKTGKYQIVQMGGAVKHASMKPIMVGPHGYDLRIFPVNGYGDPGILRMMLSSEKPDIVFLFTDPRFWMWAWHMSDEIREVCPLVYWHLWDNYPTPEYNNKFYVCNDYIAYINRQTGEMLQELKYPADQMSYIPHGLDPERCKPLSENERKEYRKKFFDADDDTFIFLWVSRNAKRKRAGDMVAAFANLKEKYPDKKMCLFMKTEMVSEQGPHIGEVSNIFKLKFGKDVIVREDLWKDEEMQKLYASADCLVNNSNAEGFGLSCLNSLMNGVPVIVTKTGGLRDQIVDGEGGFFVSSGEDSVIGCEVTPYIYEQIILRKDLIAAMERMMSLSREKRIEMGEAGKKRAIENFSLSSVVEKWDNVLTNVIRGYNVHKALTRWEVL